MVADLAAELATPIVTVLSVRLHLVSFVSASVMQPILVPTYACKDNVLTGPTATMVTTL
jgi:hypothetical protein